MEVSYETLNNNEGTLLMDTRAEKSFRSTYTLIGLSLAITGLDICYSAELVYASPLILKYHVPEYLMSFTWAFSPILGFFLTPLLGSLSDTCNLKYGKRRPFIVLLAVIIIVGALFLSQSGNVIIYFTGRGPLNSTQIDAVPTRDQFQRSGNVYDSSYTSLVVVFTVVGLSLIDFGCDACQSPARAYLIDSVPPEQHQKAFSVMGICCGVGGSIGYLLGSINFRDTAFAKILGGQEQAVFFIAATLFAIMVVITINQVEEKPPADNAEGGGDPASLHHYLMSIVYMPRRLRWLCLHMMLSWLSVLCFSLFFTDFVGQVVYKGDPYASVAADSFKNYNNGVLFGARGLTAMTVLFSIFSIFLNQLLNKIGCRIIVCCICLFFSVSFLLILLVPCKVVAFLLAACAGLMLTCVFVTPFLLIARYHDNRFQAKDENAYGLERGLGTDIAVAQSMVFAAQFTISLSKGPIQQIFGNYQGTCMILGSIYCLLAAAVSLRIDYADL
ncbi:solute carrier family 45 member 4-like isoform X2 [Symsagittifera roscoffensis]